MSKLGFSRLSSGDSGFELWASFVIRHSSFVISNMSAVNETLIRDVVSEVMERLNGSSAPGKAAPAPAPSAPPPSSQSCGCEHKGKSRPVTALRGKFGVFSDANEACAAAQESFLQLKEKGIAARRKIEEVVKTLAEKNAEAWGRLEFEETKIGRLDHKIAKLQIVKLVPGVDWLRPDARSGDHGITLEEYTPFGVIGAVTPSTHSIPTLSGNIVNICAAGNSWSSMRIRAPPVARPPPSALTTRRFIARRESKIFAASSRSRRLIPSTRSAKTKTPACCSSPADP